MPGWCRNIRENMGGCPTPAAKMLDKCPYLFYSNSIRATVKEELSASGTGPKLDQKTLNQEVLREIGKRWKTLSDEARKPWEKSDIIVFPMCMVEKAQN